MIKHNSFKHLRLFAIALCVFANGLPVQVQAQSKPANQQAQARPQRSKVSVTFSPPGAGKPDNSAGGASRSSGQCAQDPANSGPMATPLTPANYQALTVAERPTFFVYVPETSARKVFFSLEGENKNSHYQTMIPITGKAGIVSVSIPTSAPALETGKNYKWSFVIMCGNTLRPDSPAVEGTITRSQANPTLISQLEKATPIERAALYGKDGIWYDTLATVAELRKLQPNDSSLEATWTQLLTSVGLDAIATKPML
ncbi:MAG TPA: DUF928 domain-containing protein [Kamptonema sp.]|nr:DUF928 domain-containing protein [Kamptonema sp.]